MGQKGRFQRKDYSGGEAYKANQRQAAQLPQQEEIESFRLGRGTKLQGSKQASLCRGRTAR